ncbi:unnamed protein product [Gongylonema pulchrum]|uniref:Glycine rich superfamily member n=1 Tax=Gongylonema pulchrum TaxID=637853 RepID=A0A183EGE1_9BILA|nr:unnamed protein product [Gongylonema pulchrum]
MGCGSWSWGCGVGMMGWGGYGMGMLGYGGYGYGAPFGLGGYGDLYALEAQSELLGGLPGIDAYAGLGYGGFGYGGGYGYGITPLLG